jgi:hypothetical protein
MIATRLRVRFFALEQQIHSGAPNKSAPLRPHSCPIPVVPVKLFPLRLCAVFCS